MNANALAQLRKCQLNDDYNDYFVFVTVFNAFFIFRGNG